MELEPITRLTQDLAKASITLSRQEARFLVDVYYQMQENRKRAVNQARALGESEEPHEVIEWLAAQSYVLEKQVARALDKYSEANPLGRWARGIVGIGPVIAAGLLAHIDIERAPTVGHIWRFAGLNPKDVWEKGQKRPWNAELKTLCWKIGESFVKVKANREDVYGKLYQQRKDQETVKNEAGEFADQAAATLERCRIGKTTDAYKHYSAGRLPPAHIHARAKRYAVKLFLSHYHEVGYRLTYGTAPPYPYPIAILGHADKIDPP